MAIDAGTRRGVHTPRPNSASIRAPVYPCILGIDPGLANMGIVLLERGRIVEARTLTTQRRAAGFADVRRRVKEQCLAVAELLVDEILDSARDKRPPRVTVAIEAYEDFGPHLRGAKDRWMTPVLLGALDCTFVTISHGALAVHWQSPREILTATKAYREYWEAGRRGLVPGDELLTNEHLRSAACHALYLAGLLRTGRLLVSVERGILAVRRDGRAQALSTLAAAQTRAEEWARETESVVEIWSRPTGSLICTVAPDGTQHQPAKPVSAGPVREEGHDGDV